MESIKVFIHQSIKENRIKIILFSVVLSMISSLVTLSFNDLNLWYVGIALSTIVVIYIFIKINDLTRIVTSGNTLSFGNLLTLPPLDTKVLGAFFVYLGIALIAFLLTNLLMLIPYGGIVVVLIIVLIITISTGLISIVIDSELPLKVSIKEGFKTVLSNRDILFQYISKVIKSAFVGAMIILSVNIFVYAPQIQLALEKEASNDQILSYFVTPLANFIQITGSQAIVYYILFVGFISYKTLNKQLQFRRKKRSKNR